MTTRLLKANQHLDHVPSKAQNQFAGNFTQQHFCHIMEACIHAYWHGFSSEMDWTEEKAIMQHTLKLACRWCSPPN